MLILGSLYVLVMWVKRAPCSWLSLPWAVRDASPPLALGAALALALLGQTPAAALFLLGSLGAATRRPRRGPLPVLGGEVLHVATLNAGMHRAKVASVLAWIEACGADLIALQEVGRDLHEALSSGAARGYPHRLLDGIDINGMALLARSPLERVAVFGEPLQHQVATLDWKGRKVRVLNLHPFFHVAYQGLQARAAKDFPRLLSHLDPAQPALVLGDLNTTTHTRLHDLLLAASLHDAFLAVGRGRSGTFPVPLRYLFLPLPPLFRLDHILASAHFTTLRCQVGKDASSDHLPLVAALRFVGTEGPASPRP